MTLQAVIEQKCHAFAQELTAVVMDAVRDAFGRKAARDDLKRTPRAGATVRRIEPRPAPSRGAGTARYTVTVNGERPNKLAKGEKRSPLALRIVTDQLQAMIDLRPGHGIEKLAEYLGTTTRELNLPVKKLIAEKRIRTEGEKRARKYFPTKAGH